MADSSSEQMLFLGPDQPRGSEATPGADAEAGQDTLAGWAVPASFCGWSARVSSAFCRHLNSLKGEGMNNRVYAVIFATVYILETLLVQEHI